MAANKVPGVRAALCVDAETARGARQWNDANVLALSLSLNHARGLLARSCAPSWPSTYGGTEHESLAVLSALDARRP